MTIARSHTLLAEPRGRPSALRILHVITWAPLAEVPNAVRDSG